MSVLTGATRIRAISFDCVNTLCPVRHEDLARTVAETSAWMSARSGPFDAELFRRVWAEERDRQLAEEVAELREMVLPARLVRVLARLRGMPAPAPGTRWDDAAAATLSDPREIDEAAAAYSAAFVRAIPPQPEVRSLLERLSGERRLAILSNWPLTAAIETYVDAAGWRPFLAAIVVSERVGVIKPHPRIFLAAEEALGEPGASILHVGDDWAADVVGATRAGWHAAYLRGRQHGSPLPGSTRDESVVPEIELDSLEELEPALAAFEAVEPAPGG